MRTTLDIEETTLQKVREFAASRKISQGKAATILLDNALSISKPQIGERNGFPIIVHPPGTRMMSQEELQELIDANPPF